MTPEELCKMPLVRRVLRVIMLFSFVVMLGDGAGELVRAEKGVEQEQFDTNEDGVMDQTVFYKGGKKIRRESDKNFDGKVDQWDYYDEEGIYRRTAKDTNGDGQPDRWRYTEGPGVMLREVDRNFDGKVDRRQLTQFMMDRRLNIPRHLYIWKEEDNDFDGVIDIFRVRGEKDPEPTRLGEVIQSEYKTIPKKKKEKPQAPEERGTKKVIKHRAEQEELIDRSREGL